MSEADIGWQRRGELERQRNRDWTPRRPISLRLHPQQPMMQHVNDDQAAAAEAKQKRKRKYECKICMVMFQTKVNYTFLSHIISS